MKSILAVTTLLLLTLPGLADRANEYYRLGLKAMKEGRPEVAESAFKKALSERPNHPQARYQLGQLATMADALKAQRRQSRLVKIRIPEIDFREVALGDALQVLGDMIEKESIKKFGEDQAIVPNFMVQDPKGKLGENSVTLRLKNIPAKAALDYLLQQAGATARFDEHATVIRPTP